jgi:hypothetical protein
MSLSDYPCDPPSEQLAVLAAYIAAEDRCNAMRSSIESRLTLAQYFGAKMISAGNAEAAFTSPTPELGK